MFNGREALILLSARHYARHPWRSRFRSSVAPMFVSALAAAGMTADGTDRRFSGNRRIDAKPCLRFRLGRCDNCCCTRVASQRVVAGFDCFAASEHSRRHDLRLVHQPHAWKHVARYCIRRMDDRVAGWLSGQGKSGLAKVRRRSVGSDQRWWLWVRVRLLAWRVERNHQIRRSDLQHQGPGTPCVQAEPGTPGQGTARSLTSQCSGRGTRATEFWRRAAGIDSLSCTRQ